MPAYRHVATDVGSNDALTKILSTYDQWKDSLRADATKTVIVISDDDSTLSSADFNSNLLTLDPTLQSYKFNGYVDVNGNCVAAGVEYVELVNLTNGFLADICTNGGANVPSVLQEMANIIIDYLNNPTPPTDVSRDFFSLRIKETKNNGVAVIAEGKILDPDPLAIYSAETALSGGLLNVVKQCHNLSTANPSVKEKTPGVEVLTCTFDEVKHQVHVKYKALNQEADVDYAGSVQITRDQQVILSSEGIVRLQDNLSN